MVCGTAPAIERRPVRRIEMPTTPPRKSDQLGGIVLCAFPATILFAMQINGARLPMPWPILFAILFVYGIRSVMTSLFRLDLESTASWVA